MAVNIPGRRMISVLPPDEEARLKSRLATEVSKSLGVPVASLPADVQALVDEQLSRSLADGAHEIVADVAERVARDAVAKTNVGALLADRLSHTLNGILQVRQNDNVQKIMAENARLLKMKHDSYVSAGFSADQAFQLILTELGKQQARPA
jgi:hypothetical protein